MFRVIGTLYSVSLITLLSGCATVVPTDDREAYPTKERLQEFRNWVFENPPQSDWLLEQWNPGPGDPPVAARKVTCTARDESGRCVSANCEADEVSTCWSWNFWCVWYGYHLSGDSQSSTCSREPPFPCC